MRHDVRGFARSSIRQRKREEGARRTEELGVISRSSRGQRGARAKICAISARVPGVMRGDEVKALRCGIAEEGGRHLHIRAVSPGKRSVSLKRSRAGIPWIPGRRHQRCAIAESRGCGISVENAVDVARKRRISCFCAKTRNAAGRRVEGRKAFQNTLKYIMMD